MFDLWVSASSPAPRCVFGRRLGELLDVSADSTTVAVACYDLGEFIRHHPDGRTYVELGHTLCVGVNRVSVWSQPPTLFARRVIKQLGLKPKLMEQLSRGDEEVRKQALLACSKLMVDNWQFVKT